MILTVRPLGWQPCRSDPWTGFSARTVPAAGELASSVQVLTMATGRSWLMWAFMPARANWMGSIPAIGEGHIQRGHWVT